MKKYILELLYDNGIVEEYKTGEVSDDDMNSVLSAIYTSFQSGSHAVVTLPNEDGLNTLIRVSKVVRAKIKNDNLPESSTISS